MRAGLGDAPGFLMQVDRVEAHYAGQRLAMREAAIGRHQRVGGTGGHFDMIAKHAIVPDLERADAGLVAIFRLQRGDGAAAITRHAAQLVQRGIIAIGDIAAIGGFGRRGGDQRAGQRIDQFAMAVERGKQLLQQRRHVGQARKPLAQQPRFAQAVAQLAEIARAAPADGDAAERAADVGQGAQRGAQLVAQARIVMEKLDEAQPRLDRGQVHQRGGQVLPQQPRARARDRPVDRAEQAARARAARGGDDFQAFPRRRVDRDMRAARLAQRRREEGQCPLARMVEIGDEPAHGGEFAAAELAEAVQRRDPEQALERVLRAAAGESGAIKGVSARDVERRSFGHHGFAGPQPRQFGGQIGQRACQRFETASGDIGGGDADFARFLAPDLRQRHQHIVAPRIEQRFFGQRAGGDVADDVARHQRLAAARLGLRGRFGLFGDGDAVAALDEAGEIGFGAVHGHAAHRNGRAIMFAAAGERDVERRRGQFGVVEEKFEEIAHPVEEQAIARLGLERQILRHHRRGLGSRLGGGIAGFRHVASR